MLIRGTIVALAGNAYGLAKWGNYTHKSRLELLMFNKSTNAQ
jgi:hypothetical protein